MLRLLVLWVALFAGWERTAAAGVDVNSATQSELESLPGIGPSKAAAIIQYRMDHGPFRTVDELDNVSGIGPATLANIRNKVTIGGGGTAAAGEGGTAAATAPPTTSESPPAGTHVNINTADQAGLETLPGIGATKAAAILSDRQKNGLFASCDDLDRVDGIGAATVAGLRDACTVK